LAEKHVPFIHLFIFFFCCLLALIWPHGGQLMQFWQHNACDIITSCFEGGIRSLISGEVLPADSICVEIKWKRTHLVRPDSSLHLIYMWNVSFYIYDYMTTVHIYVFIFLYPVNDVLHSTFFAIIKRFSPWGLFNLNRADRNSLKRITRYNSLTVAYVALYISRS